jgi:hypothetical protein
MQLLHLTLAYFVTVPQTSNSHMTIPLHVMMGAIVYINESSFLSVFLLLP